MKIYIGADHNGFEFKSQLAQALQQAGHEVIDVGAVQLDPSDDFPQFAGKVVSELLTGGDATARGILVAGNGQGMCMAANRFKGIRASLCWNANAARSARSEDDSNVLCLSANYLSLEEAGTVMVTWLATPFAGDAGATRRIQQLDQSAA
jgi:ribose 5-phosphate isomerase B